MPIAMRLSVPPNPRRYAKTSKVNAVEWNRFTREYFVERETLVT